MKKVIILLLTFIVLFTGCSGENESMDQSDSSINTPSAGNKSDSSIDTSSANDQSSNRPKLIPVVLRNETKYGYVDERGNMVITPQFDNATNFDKNGVATITIGDKEGYIDAQGNIVVEPIYDHAGAFNKETYSKQTNYYSLVRYNGKLGIMNEKFEIIVPMEYEACGGSGVFSNGYASMCLEGKYGFVDKNGNIVIDFKYDYAGAFAENDLALVRKDGKYGFINKQGREVIPLIYDYADDFYDGYSRVTRNNKTGVINTSGEYVIAPEFYHIRYNSYCAQSGYLSFIKEKDGTWYVIDSTGKRISDYYDEINSANNSMIHVVKNKKAGYIDFDCEEIVEIKYDKISTFIDDMYGIATLNGKVGVINKKGDTVLEFIYDAIYSGAETEVFIVVKDGECFLVKSNGEILSEKHEKITTVPNSDKYIYYEDGALGLMDKSGRRITDAIFKSIGNRS